MDNTQHVIVVDDSATARHQVCCMLQNLGRNPLAAANGREAMAILELDDPAPDLIICDLVMPGMDGIGLLQRIRCRGMDIPFIIMTLHSTIGSAVEALRLGADDYLLKPFEEALLEHRMAAALSRRDLALAEREKTALEAAMATAGATAHEISQPLMAILASAQLLQEESDPDRLKKLAGTIASEADRMGKIVHRLVHMTRYRTQTYLGKSRILDINASSGPDGRK